MRTVRCSGRLLPRTALSCMPPPPSPSPSMPPFTIHLLLPCTPPLLPTPRLCHARPSFATHAPPHVNRITDRYKQECIPVGCVPPACCPYLLACTALGGVVYLPRGVPGPGRECTCPGGVPGPGEYLLRGMYLAPGGTCPGTPPPPLNRMTNRCKYITLPQTFVCGW